MTTIEKISAIREECARVNPEIKELKFGCEIEERFKKSKRYVVIGSADRSFRNGLPVDYFACQTIGRYERTIHDLCPLEDEGHFQILGRPIRLADILLAIEEKSPGWYAITSSGEFLVREFSESFYETSGDPGRWNFLKDSIDDQEEATIDFIYSVLKK